MDKARYNIEYKRHLAHLLERNKDDDKADACRYRLPVRSIFDSFAYLFSNEII